MPAQELFTKSIDYTITLELAAQTAGIRRLNYWEYATYLVWTSNID
jgi:hypothetical protein